MTLKTEALRDGAPVTRVTGAPPAPVSPTPTRRRRRGPHRWTTWQRIGAGLGGVVVLGLVLEVVSRYIVDNPAYLPPLSEVLVRLGQFFTEPDFWAQVGATLASFLMGLVIASLLGITLGVLFGLWEVSYRSSRTVIELLRPIPPVALIPVAILLFQTGLLMKTIIVLFACIWPIMFNALYGVRNVDPLMKDMARSFGRSRFDTVWHIVLPAAMPLMWTGIRVASTIALIVIITVELLVGGTGGVGGILATARAQGNDVLTFFAAIIVAGVLGLLVNILLTAIERRFFAWSTTTKEG